MANKAQELLEGIKKLIFGEEGAAVYTLADGTVIDISKLEVGGTVKIGDAPAPAGTHTLQDNSTVTVDENGVITSIAPAPAAEDTQLESHTLADGSTIDITSLEVGAAVTINGAMAPAGTYVFDDGSSITVDETGNITAITPAPVAAATDLSTPELMRAACEKFATGTPDERLANLEIIAKALMEYSFGWQIKEAADKAARDAAIATYQQKLSAAEAEAEKQKEINKQVLNLVEELAKNPSADPPAAKTVSSFSKVEPKNKALAGFAAAAQKIKEEQQQN